MSRIVKSVALMLSMLITSDIFAAASSSSSAQLKYQLNKVTRQTRQLQEEVKSLKAQVRHLHQVAHVKAKDLHAQHKVHRKDLPNNTTKTYLPMAHRIISPDKDYEIYKAALRYIHGQTVFTSPLLGLKSAYQPSDLLTQVPSLNEDLMLLRRRQDFQHVLQAMGSSLQIRPVLVLSGALEGQFLHSWGYGNRQSSDVNLNTAELDFWAIVSSWASGFLSLDYDDASQTLTGSRVTNSRIFLQRGFITIGNLDVLPIYFTIGQMFIPFGKYSSSMITSPVVKSMARTEARAAVLGLYKKGVYFALYCFTGERTSGGDNLMKQGGANLGYEGHTPVGKLDVGAGVVSNFADSLGMQMNGNNRNQTYAGFARSRSNHLVHNVAAIDAHLKWSYGAITLIGEYVTVLQNFAARDMFFGAVNRGAAPAAMQAEADITWYCFHKPFTFVFSYGRTWQALQMNLPKHSFAVVISTSFWKDTMTGIEFRHDINYPAGTIAGGRTTVTGAVPQIPLSKTGGQRNIVTLQFGVYF